MRIRHLVLLASVLAGLLAGCASDGSDVSNGERGWLGRGARYEQDGGGGPRWGFRVDDDELVLWRETGSIVFEGAAGSDGVRFTTPAGWSAEPRITFLTALGEIRWVALEVRMDDRSWVLADGGQRVSPVLGSNR